MIASFQASLRSKLNYSNFPGIVESMTQHLLSSAFSAKSGSVMEEEILQAGTYIMLVLPE